jgi:hypothetical protein
MMRRTLAAGLAAVAVTLVAVPAMADKPGDGRLAPCKYEDSNGCVWDAKHMGIPGGRSYIATPEGKVIYVPHYVAHALLFGGAR